MEDKIDILMWIY